MAIKAADQISIVDITDAYSIFLTSEAVTFVATSSSTLGTQQTATTTVVAYRGDTALVPTIGTITEPTNIDVVTGTPTTSGCTLTITAAAGLASGGEIEIPVTVDGDVTINKKFSYAIAFKGQQGGTGGTGATGVSMRNKGAWSSGTSYTAGTSGGSYIDIVTVDGSSYMCKSSHTASSSNKPPNSTYWTLMSEKGETGSQGPTGATGATGASGQDAITIVITSSAGTIFKNTSIATTLTAHVYKAGVEVTGADLTALGTIKWYKNDSSTAESTGATKTITAGSVENKVTYTAKLEA